jgi:nitroreductase
MMQAWPLVAGIRNGRRPMTSRNDGGGESAGNSPVPVGDSGVTAGEHAARAGAEPPLFDVMAGMRAMRRLRPDPVPDELLERLVEAATWAPSGSNAQAYAFVVVTGRAQMAQLAVLWRRCVDAYLASAGRATPETMDEASADRVRQAIACQRDHFHETPALIIPCYAYPRPDVRALAGLGSLGPVGLARLAARGPRLGALGEAASVYPGVQNLLLAARALGLAANITIWHLLLEHQWNAALGIPRGVHTFAVIPVGWPLGRFGPVRRRPAAQVIHRDRW